MIAPGLVPSMIRAGAAAAALVAVVAAAEAGPLPAPGGSYLLGVVPSSPAVTTRGNWTPFVERLERTTGLAFALKVYENMPDFEADVAGGGPDFVFVNPMQAVLARASQGYEPLVRSSQTLAGTVFVPRDSTVRTVEELAGKPVAFVGAKSV